MSLDSLVALFRDSLGAPSHGPRSSGEAHVRWETRTTNFRLRSTGAELFAYLRDPRLDWAMPRGHQAGRRADTVCGILP